MSKVIDQRVVEMQFDNKVFERNVSTTMSTLDKLKQKLHMTESVKSLENVGIAAKKVDMSGLSKGVETVRTRFSALEVMGVTALANITNSAVNASKRMLAAFTVEPIRTGFNEYELKMNSVQTIMASTGESIDVVNKYLQELNEYSDKTIYSFSDMTSNIGKFTNAGVKLEDAVMAIKGISNEAALSGANANEASRAMYNFSQALSAGYVKLIDWKSIENANMATKGFKEELIKTAVALGTVTNAGDGMYKTLEGNAFNATKNFNEVFQDQWMTSEVLVQTLKKYADETTDIGEKATSAAQDVKTFSMMMDTLKEAAQSGWAQTWEIMFGDLEEAKNLWTGMSKFFGNIIDKMSELRNNFLGDALQGPVKAWDKLAEKIEDAGISTEDFTDKLKVTARKHGIAIDDMIEDEGSFEKTLNNGWLTKKMVLETLEQYTGGVGEASESTENMTDKLKKFQKVVDEVWQGDFKNGAERVKALADAGYDYAEVQTLVNKTVDGHRLTLEELSDSQLKNIGYTDEQIKKIQALKEQAEKTNTPLSKLIDEMTRPSGRTLIIESFKNVLEQLQKPLNTVKEAWKATFGDLDASEALYNVIESIHEMTAALDISEGSVENFKKIFEGMYAAYQLSWGLISASFTTTIKLIRAVLGVFDLSLTDAMAIIADYIIKIRDWVQAHSLYIGTIDKVGKIIATVIEGVQKCIDAFMSLEAVQYAIAKASEFFGKIFGSLDEGINAISVENFCKQIERAFNAVARWIESLNGFKESGKNIVDGLISGLGNGAKKVVEFISNLATTLIEAFKKILGINSPSKIFIQIGGFIVAGLIIGLLKSGPGVLDTIKSVVGSVIDWVRNLDFGTIFTVIAAASLLGLAKNIYDLVKVFEGPVEAFTGMLNGIKKMFTGIGDMFSSIGESFKAQAWKKKAEAIRILAVSVGILAASLFLISKIDPERLWASVGAMGAIIGIVVAMAGALAVLNVLISKFGSSVSIQLGMTLLQLAGAILMVAFAAKLLGNIPATSLENVVLFILDISLIFALFGFFATGMDASKLGKLGSTLIKMSVAIAILAYVAKLLSDMSKENLDNVAGFLMDMTLCLSFMSAVGGLVGSGFKKFGSSLIKVSVAILLLVGIAKLLAGMEQSELEDGALKIITFGGILAALVAITRLAGGNSLAKVGSTLLAMSASMLLMTGIVKLVSGVSMSELEKGMEFISGLSLVMMALVAATRLAGGNDLKKVGTTLILMSISIGILAAIATVFGLLEPEHLYKGIAAVGALAVIMSLLVYATKFASDCKNTLVGIAIAVGVISAAVLVLSLIDPTKLLGATAAMVGLVGIMALLVLATKSMNGIKMGPILAMVGVIVALTAAIAILAMLDSDAALKSSVALSLVLVAFAGSMTILGTMKGTIANAMTTLPMMLIVTGLLATILGVMAYLDVEASLQTAASISLLLLAMSAAMAIASMAGPNALSGVIGLAAMGLVVAELGLIFGLLQKFDIAPTLNTALALSVILLAMSAAMGVAALIGSVAPAALIGIGLLVVFAAAIGLVIAALSDIISEAISGLPQMATDLSTFMTNLQPFINGAKAIDETMLAGVRSLADVIMTLTKADLLSAVTSWITGGDSLSDFANQLVPFGEAMKAYGASVAGIDITAINSSVEAAKGIVAVAEAIPSDGMFGTDGIDDFGSNIVDFAECLMDYSKEVAGLDSNAVVSSIVAARSLVSIARLIPDDGTFGTDGIDNFGDNVVDFGKSLAKYSEKVSEVNPASVDSSITMANRLRTFINSLVGMDTSGVKNYKDAISSLSKTKVGDFVETFSASVENLTAVGSNLVEAIIKGANSKNSALSSTAKKLVTAMISTIVDNYERFAKAGSTAMSTFAMGVGDKNDAVLARINGMLNTAVIKIEGFYDDFYDAGSYVVSGFAAGISANTFRAAAHASAMASAALSAAKAELREHSPSKAFYDIGDYAGQGFVNALSDYASKSYYASAAMASAARTGLGDSISKISDAINSDIDTQPTIRPVLDLSDVREGAGIIGNMFSSGASIGVLANVNSVGAMMNSRRQNGGNDDVVAAVNRLRKGLDNVGNTTYSIGGITYDDGSNISNAISDLVRYAKIERRV